MPPSLRHSISSPSVRMAPYIPPTSPTSPTPDSDFSESSPTTSSFFLRRSRRRRASDAPNPRRVVSDGSSSRRVLADIEWWRVLQGQCEQDDIPDDHNRHVPSTHNAELQLLAQEARSPLYPVHEDPDSDLHDEESDELPPLDHPSPAHSRTSSSDSDDVPRTPPPPSRSSSSIFPRYTPTAPSSSIFFPAAAAPPVLSSVSILAMIEDTPNVGIYTPAHASSSRQSRSRATSLPESISALLPLSVPRSEEYYDNDGSQQVHHEPAMVDLHHCLMNQISMPASSHSGHVSSSRPPSPHKLVHASCSYPHTSLLGL